MRMLTDNPTNNDKYGFTNYVHFLTDSIIENDDLPFLMGIYGAWGSGKSSLMSMMMARLKSEDIKCIWFNPWKYDNKEDLWSSLIQTILYKMAEETPNEEYANSVKRIAEKVAWNFVKKGVSAITHGIVSGDNLEGAKKFLIQENEERLKYINQFENDFADAIRKYTGHSKLVVFIDDLDRCSPENAITVLESLKLFLGETRCVFVLGMDHHIVEQGIQYKYGGKINISGREYLDKIIQVPFFVPPVPYSLLRQHLQEYTKAQNYSMEIWELLRIGFNSNPRKSKRFLNSFYFVLQIVNNNELRPEPYGVNAEKASSDQQKFFKKDYQDFLLAYLLIIQIRFPQYYMFVSRTGRIFDAYRYIDLENAPLDTHQERSSRESEKLLENNRQKKNLETRFPELLEIYNNQELKVFLEETGTLFDHYNYKPNVMEISSLINAINLVNTPMENYTESQVGSRFHFRDGISTEPHK